MIITSYDNFIENIVNKRKSFIFKIKYPNILSDDPPPIIELKRTTRGSDANKAIPNNYSMIYKFKSKNVDSNNIEIFKFTGYDVDTKSITDVWWYISIYGLHSVITHYIYDDVWYLDKWSSFKLETVDDSYRFNT